MGKSGRKVSFTPVNALSMHSKTFVYRHLGPFNRRAGTSTTVMDAYCRRKLITRTFSIFPHIINTLIIAVHSFVSFLEYVNTSSSTTLG